MGKDAHSDDELVRMVLDRDLEAFDMIVRRYQDAVYATALHRTSNFVDAEDVAQEAFLAAYENLSKLKKPSKLAGWLHTITLYTYNNWRRKHADLKLLDEHSDLSDAIECHRPSRPDEVVQQQEFRQRILEAVASLPQRTGEVVTLYYIDGLSYQDIADYLSVSATTVKGRLQMGRKRLREELVDMMEDTLKENRPGGEFSESVLKEIVERARQARKESAHDELLEACDEAREVMQHLEDSESKKRMGMDILRWQADEQFNWLGRVEKSAASWEEAARLAGELGMKDEQARCLLMAGITYWHSGQRAAMKPYAQQAKMLYQELDDLPDQAMCDALVDLCELVPMEWQRLLGPYGDTHSGYSANVFLLIHSADAVIWDWEERPPAPQPAYHLVGKKLRQGLRTAGSAMTFGSMAHPAKWMKLPPSSGQTWDDSIRIEEGEQLPVQTTVGSLTDTVATPAGRFENCLRLERKILEPEGADTSRRMKVWLRRRRAGMRTMWFAPGVGLVKAHHEDENADHFLYLLSEYRTAGEGGGYFPLRLGDTWVYQWYMWSCSLLFTERCQVAASRENTWYLTSACYSDLLDEEAQRDYFERLHQLERDSGHRRGEVWTLNALHNVYARLGDHDKATRLWEAQESLCAELEDEKLHYALLLRIDRDRHLYERVRVSAGQAASIARALGDPRRELTSWCYLADGALRRKEYALAADAADKAAAIVEKVDEGEYSAQVVATRDVSEMLLHAPDAAENVGTSRSTLYREGEELSLRRALRVSPLHHLSRLLPPSWEPLLGTVLPPRYEVGISWSASDSRRTIKQQIMAMDASVKVPAGIFERCLLTEAEICYRVERKGGQHADMLRKALRGFEEGTIQVWFAQGHGIVQMDYHHRNGQRTLIQLTGDELQGSDDSYFPIEAGNIWRYDWTNEKGEMLMHEMYRVMPKRGERTYIAASAYAVHRDYAG